MDLTTSTGKVVRFPEGTDPKVAQAYMDKYYPAEPGVLERTAGHLSIGAANTLGMIENLGSIIQNVPNYVTGKPVEKPIGPSPEQQALRDTQVARQVQAYPEKTWYGQLLGGAAEFLPEIPLYSIGGGMALRGATALPKVGRAATWMLEKSPSFWGGYARAIPRAATEGAIVGTAIGSPAGTDTSERLAKGIESGVGFGAATAVLHPAFAGLGAIGRSILRRQGKKATLESVKEELAKRAESDPKAQEELDRLNTTENELIVPKGKEALVTPTQGELFVDMPSEEVQAKLNALGITTEDIISKLREGKDQELIDALEKKGTPSDQTNIEGIQSSERIGEEPVAGESLAPTGETKVEADRVFQASREDAQNEKVVLAGDSEIKVAGEKVFPETKAQRRRRQKAEAEAALKVESEVPSVPIRDIGEKAKIEVPPEIEEKVERVKQAIDENLSKDRDVNKEEALDSLEERLKQPLDTEDEGSIVDTIRDLYDSEDPVAQKLVDNIPTTKEARQEKFKALVERVQADRKAKKEKKNVVTLNDKEYDLSTREGLDAYRKAKQPKGASRRGRKNAETLQNEWEKILEEEGLGEKEAGVWRGLTDEGENRELDLEGTSKDYGDIEEGVYRDEEPDTFDLGSFGTYTLDMLGLQQMYDWGKSLLQAAKTIRESPSNTIADEVAGKKLTFRDNERFVDGSVNQLKKNVETFFKYKLMTPQFAVEGDPTRGKARNEKLAPHVENLQNAKERAKFDASKQAEAIRTAQLSLSKEEQKLVKGVIEGTIKDAPDKVLEAASLVKKELEAVRELWKEHLRKEMKANLNEDEFSALSEVLAGEDIEDVIKKYSKHIVYDKLGRRRERNWIDADVIRDAVKNYTAIDSWGLNDYISHYERGQWRIVSGRKLYAKAISPEDAARKHAALIERDQSAGVDREYQLELTSSDFQEITQGLPRKSYQRLVANLAKGIRDEIDDINSRTASRLAAKGLKGRFFQKPAQQFSPYVMPRKDFLQGEENAFDILYNYFYSMHRKMKLDPVIDGIRKDINRVDVVGQEKYIDKNGKEKLKNIKKSYLNEDEATFLQDLVEAEKGSKLYMGDKIVDSILRGVTAPRAYSRFLARSREIIALEKFSYRPIAGFMNAAGGLNHVWTKVGTKYVVDGMKFLRSTEGQEFMKTCEPYLGVTLVESATGKLSTRGTFERYGLLKPPEGKVGEIAHKAIEPMNWFQWPEHPVRQLTVAANYLMARDQGMSEAVARETAIKANRFTQFVYDVASLPELMRSPTARTVLQFKPYLLKELEFVSTLRGWEIGRYLTGFVAIGGPRALVYMLKSLPILGSIYGWSEMEDWANKNFPRLSRGVPGFLGIDVTSQATPQFPTQMKDWMGPFLSDVTNFYKNVASPLMDKIANPFSEDTPPIELGKFAGQAIPIFKHWNRLIDQVVDKDGWVKDERGRRIWNIDNMATFTAKSLVGAEPIELNRVRVAESNLYDREQRLDASKQKTIDNILDAVAKGKTIDEDDLQNMVRLGVKPQTLRKSLVYRMVDPKTRKLLQTEVIRRPEILDKYPEASDLED